MAEQRGLRGWLRPVAAREDAALGAAERRARQKAAMERLGLESASTPKKRPGRPTFQQQWEKAILSAISAGKWAEVDVLQTSKVPAWYRGGNTLQPKVKYEATGHVVADAVLQLAGASEQDAAAQEAEAEALEAEDAAAQEAEAAAQEAVASCSTPKKRPRPRSIVPEAAKVWFVSKGVVRGCALLLVA